MPRTIEPGEHGEITISAQRRDEEGRWKVCTARYAQRWRAQCYFRDWSGVRRPLSVTGPTSGKARRAMELALRDRLDRNRCAGDITAATVLLEAGREWLTQIGRSDSGLSARTVQVYASTFTRYIEQPTPELRKVLTEKGGQIRDLRLSDVNHTQRLLRFLQAVADVHGTSAAHHARNVVSNILKRAIRFGALCSNAMRDVGRVVSQSPRPLRAGRDERDTTRAFTREERATLIAYADAKAAEMTVNPRTQRKWQAAADLLAFMAGTGARITEVRTLRWKAVDDGCAGALLHGKGSKDRHVDLPPSLVRRIERRRAASGGTGYVFSAPALADTEKPWDQSGCAKAVSTLIVGAGFSWATPHALRRTAITLLHKAGVPDVEVSDLAGHSDPNVTRKHYWGRDLMGSRPHLAAVLDL